MVLDGDKPAPLYSALHFDEYAFAFHLKCSSRRHGIFAGATRRPGFALKWLISLLTLSHNCHPVTTAYKNSGISVEINYRIHDILHYFQFCVLFLWKMQTIMTYDNYDFNDNYELGVKFLLRTSQFKLPVFCSILIILFTYV